jgi:VIT1/CCC1 family predicted Fe2+/Mn2+ transporter
MIALELLGVLVWVAAVVAVHEALAGTAHAPPAALITIVLSGVALAALWARTARLGRPPPLP